MSKKIAVFPTYNLSLGDSILMVKNHLDNDNYAIQSKTMAIANVANMETHNSVSKADLIRALRWLFEHYEF